MSTCLKVGLLTKVNEVSEQGTESPNDNVVSDFLYLYISASDLTFWRLAKKRISKH
jgi:hypothetical protein